MPNVTVSAYIPLELWQTMNRKIRDEGYRNQSEFIRTAIQNQVREEKTK